MSIRALHEEIKWREIPIPYKERVGRSKLSVVRDGMRFLETILWTALCYNPVRILGGVGLGLAAITALIGIAILALRLTGTDELGPWGIVGVFVASLCAFAGTTLFALGTTWNYLVSLFHKNPIRQGLFGRPLLRRPLERHFGWLGVGIALSGLVTGIVSLSLGLGGWAVERLWFYLLGAAMCLILGIQLTVFGIMTRVLAELNHRELEVGRDLLGTPCELRVASTAQTQSEP